MNASLIAALILTALLAAAAARGEEVPVPTFTEETASAGLSHSFTGEWTFMVGGGAAVFDCSGDLLPELFLTGGTAPSQLFLNESQVGGALKLTAVESGLEIDQVSGAWPLDIDGDGITDLAVLRVGPDKLLKGLGDCKFQDASAEWGFDGLDLWSTAFAATWEEGNTWPTLAIGSYIDRTQEAFPWGSCTPNHLYRPLPGGGYGPPQPLTPGFCALSILFTDWNRSGTPSLRVSNDREYYKGGQEQLWHMGPEPKLYTPDEGWARLRIWGMGIAQADLTGDGYPEYYLTSMADNKLQVLVDSTTGKPQYTDQAFKRGITAHRPFTGGDPRPSTAWHVEFDDVNNDGLLDLYIVKGNVWEMPDFASLDPNNLLLQRPDGTFLEAAETSGALSMEQGRGGALADLNADGLLDMIAVNRNAPTQLWRQTGAMGQWLSLRLTLPQGNRDAIGAIVELRAAGIPLQTREITVGGGHGGGELGWQHFGLGTATEAEIRVTWPGSDTPGPWQTLAATGFWLLAPQADPVAVPR